MENAREGIQDLDNQVSIWSQNNEEIGAIHKERTLSIVDSSNHDANKKIQRRRFSKETFMSYLDRDFIYKGVSMKLKSAMAEVLEESTWAEKMANVFTEFNKQLQKTESPISSTRSILKKVIFWTKQAGRNDFRKLLGISAYREELLGGKGDKNIIWSVDSSRPSKIETYDDFLNTKLLSEDNITIITIQESYREHIQELIEEEYNNLNEENLSPIHRSAPLALDDINYIDPDLLDIYTRDTLIGRWIPSATRQYAKGIYKENFLSNDEQLALIKEIRGSNDDWIKHQARERLIRSMLWLVYIFASRVVINNPFFELSDIIQEGNLKIMEAIDSFDPKYGSSFKNYALTVMSYYIRNIPYGEGIYMPRNIYGYRKKVEKAKKYFSITDNFNPQDIEKIVQNTGIGKSMVEWILYWPEMYSTNIPLENSLTIEDMLPEKSTLWPEEMLHAKEMRSFTNTLIEKKISDKAQIVIKKRLWLDGEPQTLEEIATTLNITRERVRQIQEEALLKLKRYCVAQGVTPDIFITGE